MATDKVVVNVMDVGQGQGNFVEVYDGTTLTNTLLFDLGSAKASRTAGTESINYIAGKVASMTHPMIDFISLSHKDRDHRNLVTRLIDAIEDLVGTDTGAFSIGEVRFGGNREWYPDRLFKRLEKYCLNVLNLPLRHTGYNKLTSQWTAIWSENDVSVYIALANVPTEGVTTLSTTSNPKKRRRVDSELANCVSILSNIKWNQNEFLINGDATFTTFQEFNKTFKNGDFPYTKMVTLPHHGSRKTTFGLSSSTATALGPSVTTVTNFAKRISGKTVTASAEIYGRYHHPSYDVMTYFNRFADSTTTRVWYYDPSLANNNRHYLTAYLDTSFTDSHTNKIGGVYSSFETTMNVFSTLYRVPDNAGNYLAPPTSPVGAGTTFPTPMPYFPYGVQWVYTVLSTGITLTRTTNRTLTAGTKEAKRTVAEDLPYARPLTKQERVFNTKPPVNTRNPRLTRLKAIH